MKRFLPLVLPSLLVWSTAGRLPAEAAPSLSSQPAGLTVNKGTPVTLTVIGTGDPAPSYQWYHNGTAIPAAHAPTLTLPAAAIPDDGTYFVRLSNVLSGGPASVDSNAVTVSVLYPGEGLQHRYSFTGNLNDSIGTAHGAGFGSPVASAGSNSLVLTPSASQHVRFPASGADGLNMNTYTQLTVEVWCQLAEHNNKVKLYEFGNSNASLSGGTNYLYFAPRTTNTGSALAAMGFTDNGTPAERIASRSPRLTNISMSHLVCVYDPVTGTETLYLNGQVSATASSFAAGALPPLSALGTGYAVLGRSLFNSTTTGSGSNFAHVNGTIDEFRIYNVALSPADVLANFAAGPNSPPSAPTAISFAVDPQPASITDSETATFTVDVDGPKPLTLQWYKNNSPIPGATSATCTLPGNLADNGATVFCRATAGAQTQDSAAATLTVSADTTPPVITALNNSGFSAVVVRFSEPVTAATATALTNYSLTPATAVTAAALSADGTTVTLTTATLTSGTTYELHVSGLTDRAGAANGIAHGTSRRFTVFPFTVATIGTPATSAGANSTPAGELALTASGSLPLVTADQYGIATESISGNFDLRVKVGALTLTDMWAQAGLIARSGTAAGGGFAASVATPGPGGCFFMARTATNGTPALSGSFPVNYPDTWLRLQRVSNTFTGYASLDGVHWTRTGSATAALGTTLQVGVYTSSGTDAPATALFSQYGPATGAVPNAAPLPVEPDGPSSRRSPVVISEIHYHPDTAGGTADLEFVEIHNTAGWQEDLGGWALKGGIDYTFPAGTILRQGGYLVVAAAPADLAAAGFAGALGPWSGSLSNGGDTVRLQNALGGTIAEVTYNNKAPWPLAADGLGHSLVLTHPSYGEGNAQAWSASDAPGGSPGRRDPWTADPAQPVRISEFLANSEAPAVDFIELRNTAAEPVDLGGCRLGDSMDRGAGYTFPSPTLIPAHGYTSLTENELGFSLSSAGEQIWLARPGGRVLDILAFSGQDVNVSRDHDLRELAAPTPGAANPAPLARPLVISEIMYNPPSGDSADEYIEIANRSAAAVDASGWQISGGIDFTIPAGTSIAPGGYLVIAKDRTHLLGKGYASLTAAGTLGNYAGSLSNRGERIALRMPVTYASATGPAVAYAVVNEVTYGTGGEWGRWADGGGSSLELRDLRADNRLPSDWADSDESAKAPWTSLSVSMRHDYRMPDATSGTNQATANRVEFFLQGAGECLVDDIEILDSASVNYTDNGGFENGLGTGTFGWIGQGDQKQISLETSGAASGSNCLRLIASDRGDTGANRVRRVLTTDSASPATLTDGATYTVKAKVRWIRGSRYFHLRTRGNGLELAGVLDLPATPGTPGAANSTAVANAGPAITAVAHWPVLPAAAEDVVISARISDPDNISTATLSYRIDPSNTLTSVAMKDDGTGGDALADDGIWSATLPGQASGALTAWTISATDAAGVAAGSSFPAPDPLLFPASFQSRECYVRYGETPPYGNLGNYHLWITSACISEWNNREKNSNQPLPGTFVLGNYRAFYNVSTLYSGSPWHTGNFNGPTGTGPGANQCDYEVIFNPDDLHLGVTDFILQNQSGTTNSCQDEATSFWIARQLGLPGPNRRPVHLYVNGLRRGTVFEDAEQPSGESIRQYQRNDTSGTLYKVEDWFEFDDAGSSQNYFNANLPATSTTVNGVSGVKKMARYRWNWRVRSQADPNTYEPIYELADLMNAPVDASFVPNLEARVDLHSWLGVIMTNHIIGNKDAYGYERGKNGYVYKADTDRWKAYIFDMDFSLGAAQDPATSNLFSVNADPNASKDGQPETAKLFGIPATKRICWNILSEAANGPLSGSATVMIDQRYADFLCNGIAAAAPTNTRQYIADRRNYILGQLPSANFATTSATPDAGDASILVVRGTSPVTVTEIVINGVPWAVTWTSDTVWTARYQMASGLNTLTISGINRLGETVATANPVTATYNGTVSWTAARINEWMSANNTWIADPADGSFDDWFEIYNPSAQPLDLAGWFLSDDPADPGKFPVPSGVIIPAGGFLRVWADNAPIQTSAGQLHAAFKLSNSGDEIILTAPDLSTVDSVSFRPQANDSSAGRYPDGGPSISDLSLPSGGAPNILAVWQEIAMTPAGFTVQFTTVDGLTYLTESSDDLLTWSLLNTATASGPSLTILDSGGLLNSRRYYRVSVQRP